MSTPLAGKFQDHYEVLGIEPKADSETLHKAYSALATKYHANNKDTSNRDKFAAATLAYEVLSDPAARKLFDGLRGGGEQNTEVRFSGTRFFESVSRESARRFTVLCLLYDRRQQNPFRPSLSLRQLVDLLDITEEEMNFTIWYLKKRNYLLSDDKSSLQITVEGMDYLEKNLPPVEIIQPFLRQQAA